MNIGQSCSSGSNAKKKCPFSEKCFRRNPIHFSEMSHPHLENLVVNQLDGLVTIPEHLDFYCKDKSLLLDQLTVLQMVLRKERDKEGGNNPSQTAVTPAKTKAQSVSNPGQNAGGTFFPDLVQKIERNKEAAAARRAAKLKEMDAKALSLSKPSTSSLVDGSRNESASSKDNQKNEVLQDLRERIEKRCNIVDKNSQGTKRSSEDSGASANSFKKNKNDTGNGSTSKNGGSEPSQSSRGDREGSSGSKSSESSKGSLIEKYTLCDTIAARDMVRLQAIQKMRMNGHQISIVEPGDFALKYALSAPYHYFLTRVEDSKPTYDQQFSITFPEILDRSLGEIVSSLQMNFMVDVAWLCLQYLLASQRADMLIFYGERVDTETLPPNIKAIEIQMPAFGCHHTKLMVLKYSDNGIRVVISTANLYSDDWENRTQGLWISPHLPRLPDSANPGDGESPTGFKNDFLLYFQKYNQSHLKEWIEVVGRADFSSVNVFFVASVPGNHKGTEYNNWGHRKLAAILSQHATLPENAPNWPIVAQCSSIGSLGPNYESWLSQEIISSMARQKDQGLKSYPNFQFIYPSINDYKQSFDMRTGISCLPYSMQCHKRQLWLQKYLYKWKASSTARDRAIPHIKTYTRISPDKTEIPWFVLTSGNLSKAAWGYNRSGHYVMSYEAGVVFIPQFVTGKTTFRIKGQDTDGTPIFPLPYDVPLTRYRDDDKPFVADFFSGYE